MKLKIGDIEVEIRADKPKEEIEFTAHSGECKYCKGLVKMLRDFETGKIQVDNCRCFMCGQPYFVKLKPFQTPQDWELEQWRQKGQKLAMEGDVSNE